MPSSGGINDARIVEAVRSGKLDEKLVDVVMDVLEKLRSKHFSIGLISHVEELKHRIDNKIIVSGATDRSGSSVRVEAY